MAADYVDRDAIDSRRSAPPEAIIELLLRNPQEKLDLERLMPDLDDVTGHRQNERWGPDLDEISRNKLLRSQVELPNALKPEDLYDLPRHFQISGQPEVEIVRRA